jgi:hypothetical protein
MEILVELGKPIGIVPNLFVVCLENMRTISMNINIFNVLCVTIASNMIALVNNQAGLAFLSALLREDGTE